MDLGQSLVKRLKDAGIAGGKVYWLFRPQGSTLPAVVMQLISEDRPQHLKGFEDMRTGRVQVSALSQDYGQAKQILEAAIAVLVPSASVTINTMTVDFWRSSLDGTRDTSEEVAGIGLVHRPLTDLFVRYRIR